MPDRQQGTPDDLHAIVSLAGKILDLVPVANSASWTTLAMGGYGSCTFSLPGWWTRDKLPHLANVKLYWGDLPLWEGRVEDLNYSLGDTVTTTVQCFGYSRLLTDTSIRRVWMKRDINWVETDIGTAGAIFNNQNLGGPPSNAGKSLNLPVAIGRFDTADPTKLGFRFTGNAQPILANYGNCVEWKIPVGISLLDMYYDAAYLGTSFADLKIKAVTDNDNYPTTSVSGAGGGTNVLVTFLNPLVGIIHMGVINENLGGSGTITPAVTENCEFTNIRLLGVSLPDVPTGYYGDTILRDLISLIPGLTAGDIESGSDFTIEQIERTVRDTAQSVVDEVASYYAREWGVWEDARFNWKTPNLDEPQWIVDLPDLSGLQLDTSIDTIVAKTYVLYSDPAGVDAEQSATSADQRNPFVKTGATKDGPVSVGFPMTTNTATQLAARLVADAGGFPSVSGSITLPLIAMVDRPHGQQRPAAAIKAGENILIPGLPKSEPFTQGRDGQTLFHIVSTSADMASGQITLQVEGYTKTSDALLARLASVTRTLTG